MVEPRPNEIQIDLDGFRALDTFTRQVNLLRWRGLARRWRIRITPSHTRGHVHAVIRLPRARPLIERVLLAALLGSDLKREAFNYIRVKTRRRVPVALFEKRHGR